MIKEPFDTDIADDGARLAGPWRSPRQMLAGQVYDDHVSIHDDKAAKRLGFKGGTIEGPTHFTQFAPLGGRLWGEAWFETGCLSAHYRNPVFEGEEVQAVMMEPPAVARETDILMIKRDGAEVLRGTASIAGARGPTALERRFAEGLPPLRDAVILADVRIGMKSRRQRVRMDFDQEMGALYPFSLRRKLAAITEPSWLYDPGAARESRWGRAIIPFEMLSVLFQYTARDDGFPVRGPAVGLFADQEIRLVEGPAVRWAGLRARARDRRVERQPAHRKPVGAHVRDAAGIRPRRRPHAAQSRDPQGLYAPYAAEHAALHGQDRSGG